MHASGNATAPTAADLKGPTAIGLLLARLAKAAAASGKRQVCLFKPKKMEADFWLVAGCKLFLAFATAEGSQSETHAQTRPSLPVATRKDYWQQAAVASG